MENLVKLCYDLSRGTVPQTYSTDEANEVVRKAFQELLGTDKPDWRDYRRHKVQIFEIIEDTLVQSITDGWQNNPFFDRFAEVKNLALGDKNLFYAKDRTMLLVSKIAGSNWDLRKQRLDIGSEFSVPTEWYGVSVMEVFDRFMAGRIDWPELVAKVAEAFDYEIKSMAYESFIATQTYLPTNFKETGSFSKPNLRKICAHVEAASGVVPIIAGTKVALSNIIDNIDANWVSDTMRDAKNNTGLIPVWEGYSCLPIPQVHKKNSFDFKIADDILMVLPGDVKCIKIVNEGIARVLDIGDSTVNMDMSLEYQFQMKFGVASVFPTLFGMYKIVSGS